MVTHTHTHSVDRDSMLIIQLILNWLFLFLKKRRNTVKHSVCPYCQNNLKPKKQIRLKEHERQNISNQTGGTTSNKADSNVDIKSCTVTPSASVTKFATFTSQIKEDINQGVGELVKKAAMTPAATTTTNVTPIVTTTSMTKKIDPDSINGASKITTKTANLKR